MTTHQKVLALEAALCACDGALPEIVSEPLARHLAWLLEGDADKDFGTYLKEQHEAVLALANEPSVFGETGGAS